MSTPAVQSVTVAQGAVIEFRYDRQTYVVHFNRNANDATGTMADLSMVGGVARKLPANEFARPGYSFLGWNTKDDGTGTSYADQAQVKNLAARGEVTLYAQWILTPSGEPSSTGTYTFALKTGQTVHFTNVPAGTTYSVVETDLPNGWTQTASVDTTGTIAANATSAAIVTNTYSATGVVSLQARKTMRSGSLAEGQFSFQLLNADKSEVLQTKTSLAPAYGTATAQVLFDQIDYKLSDLLKEDGTYADREYTYYIREVIPEENDRQPGVEYDNGGDREVKVSVHDTGTGTLTVTPNNLQTTGEGSSAVTTSTTVFTNDYRPGSLEVSKTTTGTNEASAGASFTFSVRLTDAQGEPVSRSYDLVKRVADGTETRTENGAEFINGTAAITGVHNGESFRIEGIAKDATYEVSEFDVPGGFTQSAVAGGEGTIDAGQTSKAGFTNAYAASGSVTLAAKKTLEGGSLADHTFTFQLYDQTNKLLQTKASDAQGNVTFDALGFSAADAGTQTAPKKYTYKIAEVNDAQENVVYDTHSGWLDVNVWDNGEGVVTAQAIYDHKGGDSSATPETFKNKLLHPVELPATGGSGLAVPVAVVVIVATAGAARRMRRRLD